MRDLWTRELTVWEAIALALACALVGVLVAVALVLLGAPPID